MPVEFQSAFVGAVFLLMGLWLVLMHRRLAAFTIRTQNRFYGFQLGARSARATGLLLILLGVILMAVGLLAFCQLVALTCDL